MTRLEHLILWAVAIGSFMLGYNTAGASCFYSVKIKPEQVYDGDTIQNVKIDLDFNVSTKQTIRLLGIDTPELRGVSKAERRRAIKARDRVRELVSGCQSIRLIPSGSDSFGRTLARVFCGNRNISRILIEEGLGKPYSQ